MKVSLRITDSSSGLPREITVDFTSDETAHVAAFLRYANELETCRMLREKIGASINLSFREAAGISFSTELPPSDDLMVLLHLLRPLILQDEHASFHRTKSLIGRKLGDVGFRKMLKSVGDHYSGADLQSQVVMLSNNEIMNSEKMLFTWLNAYEYHRDQSKQAFLESLHQILPLEWSKGVFVLLLLEKVEAIRWLVAISEMALGKRDNLTFKGA